MHFGISPSVKNLVAKQLMAALSNRSISAFPDCDRHRPHHAIDEIAEGFARQKIAVAVCKCNGKTVYFLNEEYLSSDLKKNLSCTIKTRYPDVYTYEPNQKFLLKIHPVIAAQQERA